ncbi:hypothetical protein BaRGS_00007664 [Batillaria attramentaria]|uniref:Uncharacterized protein n=1 Tax=Batillaria attramentaria TaxID=370345 RepID=A0ABD0LNZ0_9CAEN
MPDWPQCQLVLGLKSEVNVKVLQNHWHFSLFKGLGQNACGSGVRKYDARGTVHAIEFGTNNGTKSVLANIDPAGMGPNPQPPNEQSNARAVLSRDTRQHPVVLVKQLKDRLWNVNDVSYTV